MPLKPSAPQIAVVNIMRTFIIRSLEIRKRVIGAIEMLPIFKSGQLIEPPIEIVIREYKAKRTTDANRYYWRRLHEIAEQVWIDGRQFSADAWHEHYKRELLGSEDLPGGGTKGISTTTLSVQEFWEYTTKVEIDGAAKGVRFSENQPVREG